MLVHRIADRWPSGCCSIRGSMHSLMYLPAEQLFNVMISLPAYLLMGKTSWVEGEAMDGDATIVPPVCCILRVCADIDRCNYVFRLLWSLFQRVCWVWVRVEPSMHCEYYCALCNDLLTLLHHRIMENSIPHIRLLNSQDCRVWCLEGQYILVGAESDCVKRYNIITIRACTIANSALDYRTPSVSSNISCPNHDRCAWYRRRSLSTSSSIVGSSLVVIGRIGGVLWSKAGGGRVRGGRHFCEYLW